jgi:adenylate cyclase
MLKWDWRSSEDAYARALMLNPSLESAHRSYAALLITLDRPDEAIREVERACELDPLCLISRLSAAAMRYLAGHDDLAIERCRHTIDMDPGRAAAYRLLGAALLQSGEHDQARAALETAMTLAPDDPISLAWLAHARGVADDVEGATVLLDRLRSSSRYVPPYHLALAHAGLGDLDAAFLALDNACIDRDPMVAFVTIEPRFEALRSDPRFANLRSQMTLNRYPD